MSVVLTSVSYICLTLTAKACSGAFTLFGSVMQLDKNRHAAAIRFPSRLRPVSLHRPNIIAKIPPKN